MTTTGLQHDERGFLVGGRRLTPELGQPETAIDLSGLEVKLGRVVDRLDRVLKLLGGMTSARAAVPVTRRQVSPVAATRPVQSVTKAKAVMPVAVRGVGGAGSLQGGSERDLPNPTMASRAVGSVVQAVPVRPVQVTVRAGSSTQITNNHTREVVREILGAAGRPGAPGADGGNGGHGGHVAMVGAPGTSPRQSSSASGNADSTAKRARDASGRFIAQKAQQQSASSSVDQDKTSTTELRSQHEASAVVGALAEGDAVAKSAKELQAAASVAVGTVKLGMQAIRFGARGAMAVSRAGIKSVPQKVAGEHVAKRPVSSASHRSGQMSHAPVVGGVIDRSVMGVVRFGASPSKATPIVRPGPVAANGPSVQDFARATGHTMTRSAVAVRGVAVRGATGHHSAPPLVSPRAAVPVKRARGVLGMAGAVAHGAEVGQMVPVVSRIISRVPAIKATVGRGTAMPVLGQVPRERAGGMLANLKLLRAIEQFRSQDKDGNKRIVRRLDVIADKLGQGGVGQDSAGGMGGLLSSAAGAIGGGLGRRLMRSGRDRARGRPGTGRPSSAQPNTTLATAESPGGAASPKGQASPTASPAKPGALTRLGSGLTKRLPVLGAIMGAATLAEAATSAPEGNRAGAISSAAGGIAGGVGGASAGAAIGSMILPGVGTVVGAAIGGAVGGIGGEKLGQSIGEAIGDGPMARSASAAFESVAQTTKSGFEQVQKTVTQSVTSLSDAITSSPLFKQASEIASNITQKAGEAVDAAKDKASHIAKEASALVSAAQARASELAAPAIEKAQQVGTVVKDGAIAAGQAAAGVASNVAAAAGEVAGDVARTITPEPVKQWAKGAFGIKDRAKARAIENALTFQGGKISGLDATTQQQLIASTLATESNGGNYQAIERKTGGAIGAYQATPGWLADAGLIRGGADAVRAAMVRDGIDPKGKAPNTRWMASGGAKAFMADPANWVEGMSQEKYLASKQIQDTAYATVNNKTYKQLEKEKLVDGLTPPEKVASLLKAAHIGGPDGYRSVAAGRPAVKDHNGTSPQKYAQDILTDAGGYRSAIEAVKAGQSIQAVSSSGEALTDKAAAVGRNISGTAYTAAAHGAAAAADMASRTPEPVKQGARAVAGAAGRVVPDGAKQAAKTAAKKLVYQGRFDAIKDNLSSAAHAAGVDPATLAKITYFESKFDTNALSGEGSSRAKVKAFDGRIGLSTAHGLGQFTDDTWTSVVNKYGGAVGVEGAGTRGSAAGTLTKDQAAKYRTDPKIQARMLAEFTRDNIEMGRKLGGSNDDANVYALHNLGTGDGQRVLKALQANPNMSVRDALIGGRDISPKEAKRIESVISGNQSLYGNGSITVQTAYGNMGKAMTSGQAYADQISSTAATAQATAPAIPSVVRINPAQAPLVTAPARNASTAGAAAQTSATPASTSTPASPAVPATLATISAKPAMQQWLTSSSVPALSPKINVAMPNPERSAYTPIPSPVLAKLPEPTPVAPEPPHRLDSGGRHDRMTIVVPTSQSISDRHIASVITGGIGAN